MTKDPTLAEVNCEIRRIKRMMKGNEEVRDGLKMLDSKLEFISEVETMIEHQKEIIKCLNNLKEKLS